MGNGTSGEIRRLVIRRGAIPRKNPAKTQSFQPLHGSSFSSRSELDRPPSGAAAAAHAEQRRGDAGEEPPLVLGSCGPSTSMAGRFNL
jgi:hypothetical protein